MKITPEKIKRFFKKQCTPDEAMQVAEFLKSNPAVLDNYLSETEWNEAEINDLVHEDFWNEVWHGIQKKKQTGAPILWFKYSAVAACIIFIFCLSYYFIENKTRGNNETISNINAENKSTLVRIVQHKRVENTTTKTLRLSLDDGSRIILSPNSIISYDFPFAKDKREVFLEGEAVFKVAHNKTKPFTVFSGGLATTALGTEFKVTNIKRKPITVKLFKGKVVIRSTDADLRGWSKNIYLHPGEQMEYDRQKMLAAVTAIDNSVLATKSANKILNKKEPAADNNNLVFSSTPLPGVMDKLAAFFNKKIIYDSTQINAMNFTGTISKDDSLRVVLKLIAQMNDLDINQQGEDFFVEKSNK